MTTEPKRWHAQEEIVCKEMGEQASSYRWLHNKAAHHFRRVSLYFSIPVIVISTLTGTATVAQETLFGSESSIGIQIMGALSLAAALIRTLEIKFGVSELAEGHRLSSAAYGKLSRGIRAELALPAHERNFHGKEFINNCRIEIDRLQDLPYSIPTKVAEAFEVEFGQLDIFKPEILEVHAVPIYDNSLEEAASTTSRLAKEIEDAAQAWKSRSYRTRAKSKIPNHEIPFSGVPESGPAPEEP